MSSFKSRWALGPVWLAYGVFWIGGVGGHLLYGGTPPEMAWTAPTFLALAALLVILSNPQDWRALLISYLAGFTAEALGVASGYPFGFYSYSGALAPQLLGVPLVVAGAWMVLIAWVRQMILPAWAGAIVMTLFDVVIDPLAANTLAYWKWKTPGVYYGIPLLNFAGWFVVSFLILALLGNSRHRNFGTVLVGCSILLFFSLLGFAHGFSVPTAAGVTLCGAGYWRWRSSNVSTRI